MIILSSPCLPSLPSTLFSQSFDAVRAELEQLPQDTSFDAVRAELEQLPSDTLALQQLGMHSGRRLLQLDVITEQLATQVMNHHQKMVQGMQLVGELDRELRVVSVICRNARRHLNKAMEEVASDLVVAASVNKKKMLTSMLPVLMRMQQVVDVRGRMDACIDEGDFARALRLCSHCLVLIEQNAQLAAIRDMNISIEEWLTQVVDHVDALLFTVCKSFDSPSYAVVIDAYAVMDDAATLADKVQNFFAQSVVTCTYDTLLQFLEQAMGEDDGHRSRLAYSELCVELPDGVFRLCLLRTLRVLFDLFSSHHHMMTWRHPYVRRPNTMSMDRFPRMAASDPTCASAPVSASSSASDLPQLARIPAPPNGLPRSSSVSASTGSAAAAAGDAAGGPASAAGGASAGEGNGAAASSEGAAAGGEGRAPGESREGLHARRRSHSLVIEIPGGGEQLQEKIEEGYSERDKGAEPGKAQDGERKGGSEGAGGTGAEAQQQRGHAALQQQRRQQLSLQPQQQQQHGVGGGDDRSRNRGGGGGADMALRTDDVMMMGSDFREGSLADLPPNVARKMRVSTTAAVCRALQKNRKAVWELAARRVGALLTAPALCSGSSQQFLQCLEWVDKFAAVGEAFTGVEAAGLRTKMVKQSEVYFNTFHRQNLKVGLIHCGLESTQNTTHPWQVLLQAESLRGGNGSRESGAVEGVSSGGEGAKERRDFREWLERGNPFAAVEAGEEEAAEGREGGEGAESGERSSSGSGGGTGAREGGAGAGSGRGRRSSEAGGGNVGGGGGLDTGLALTGAALTVVRCVGACVYQLMDRYTRLMGLLPPIASGIFAGLCQLFDLYLVTVFRLFGSPDAVSTLRSSDPAAAALLTPKLRTTLARVAQGLDDARNRPISSSGSLAGGGSNNVLVSSSNMFGLKERCVAMESLMWLTDMLRQTKPRFQSLLAPPAWTNMDVFYARTLDAVPDLWEHVLRTLVKLLLSIAGTADRIAAVNWEPADIGTQHNIYVENLVAEFRLFAHRLGQSGAPRQVQDQLVAYGLDELCDVMLDGICRVKKCNSNGRALMSLDLQVLVQGLQPIVGRGAVKGLQLVDNYIKAFYLSESQIIDWVRAHPEYTKAQVIALVVMAANGGNWKLKNKFEIIKKIDTAFMDLNLDPPPEDPNYFPGGPDSGYNTGSIPRNTESRLRAAAFRDRVTDDSDVVAAAFRERVFYDGDAAHPSGYHHHHHHYPGREPLVDFQPPAVHSRDQARTVADRSQPFDPADGGPEDLAMDGADQAEGIKGGSPLGNAASPDRTLMRSAPPCSGEDSAGADCAGADSGGADCAGFDVAQQPCAREMAPEFRRSAERGAARAWRGSGYFAVLPDNLCAKIASCIVHAKSLVAFRSTCSYLRRVVRVGGALVFLAEDFPHREAAERGITQALLQATAAVTSLYVEAPPASDPFQVRNVPASDPFQKSSSPPFLYFPPTFPTPFSRTLLPFVQELAVMTWCLVCRDSLEELTLVDGTADAAILTVVAGDMVADLLACCSRLQELTLLLCSGIGPLDLMHAPCAELRRFEVRLSNRAARKDACLELLRLNAPNLELTGDDWSWGTVRAILDLCALSLEELSLTCYIDPLSAASIDTATAFFSSLPSLRFLLLCPSVYYVMIATLGDTKVIRAPSLEEFHVEYHDHAMAVIAFLTALLRGSPRLRCIQPMVTVPQEPGKDLLGDKDFRQAISRLQAEFPRVCFPSVWQLS
ncbi:unnamed protein product [Closterium sp. Yama58-4]|nr:unnamed protein product [Closterium sp. Yama58-4]